MKEKDEPTKLLTHCYKILFFLQSEQQGAFIRDGSSIHGQKFLWKKQSKGFELKLTNIPPHAHKDSKTTNPFDSFELQFSNWPRCVEKLGNITCSDFTERECSDSYKSGMASNFLRGDVRQLSSKLFDSDYHGYHRVIFPCHHKPNLSSFLQTETFISKVERVSSTLGVTIHLESYEFHLIERTVQNSYFLFIDCENELDWETFRQYVFSIMMSYGFTSGYFPFNDGYFFSYDSKAKESINSFACYALRGALYPNCPPITTNPYSRTQNDLVHNEFKGEVPPLTSKQFSKLCYEARHTPEISTAILTFLEASCATLLLCVQNYFVILETLAHSLKQEEQTEQFKLPKRVLESLRKVLQNSDDLSDTEKSFLRKKLTISTNLPTKKS